MWGAVLAVGGSLLLAVNLGWLTPQVWTVALPGLLIVLGVLTLVAANRPAAPAATEELEVPRAGMDHARVKVAFGAGRLGLAGGAQSTNLIEGRFGGGVDLERRSGPSPQLELRIPREFFGRFFTPWTWWSGGRLEWDIRLNEGVRFDLEIETGASEGRLDLRRLQLDRFRLWCGATSVEVVMPERSGLTRAKVETGAASVSIEIPRGVEARIRSSAGLADIKVDQGRFLRSGDGYQSAGFDTAENRLELELEAGMASIDVR